MTQHDDMVMSLQIQAFQLYEQTVAEEVTPDEEMIPETHMKPTPTYGLYGYNNYITSIYDDRWDS